ncbi:hypothetical protein CC80DRAFT_115657 [Byssothecium circinans]|uniref:Uncharacterized protein n=1 Tax=Byssothecium circinans TaxID=147558 RepID=A0A6A5U0Q9_9PLEO|nr:hypothetical protein CC80DRAFT_115657 [Byssothecium circinans]
MEALIKPRTTTRLTVPSPRHKKYKDPALVPKTRIHYSNPPTAQVTPPNSQLPTTIGIPRRFPRPRPRPKPQLQAQTRRIPDPRPPFLPLPNP